MAASQLEQILARLLVPDNEVIKQVGRWTVLCRRTSLNVHPDLLSMNFAAALKKGV